MRAGNILGMVIFVVVAVSAAAAAASGDIQQQQKWWKWMSSSSAASSSVVNPVVSSSIVLPLYGNVYPIGYYYVQLNIGHPSRPFFLDPDTGSDLTWLQCDAPCVRCTRAPHPFYKPNNDLVPCHDPLCASLHHADYKCESPEQCDYQVDYADGGSSLGVLLNDVFTFNMTNGARMIPRLALGCGYDQLPGQSYHPLDGVLGLGKGKASIVSQLHSKGLVRNVVGHCLSSRGGGFLFFGDEVYDSSHIVWTPMAHDHMKHYSAGSGELVFGGKGTGFKNLFVVFDSGSSFSYLNSHTYQGFISLSKGSVCLGVLNGTEAGLQNVNLIGDISMQDKMVTYDNEKQAIGWSPANCDRPPKSSNMIM
ncbi:unnamed protein product [Withania somnifera]